MREDLTVIFLTANLVPEEWVKYHRHILTKAIDGTALITISRKPVDFGYNLIDDGEKSTDNIYRQLLRGAKEAKTKYIAVAEDDVLYPEDHFTFYRPEDDVFAYNKNRLLLFTWGEPMYHWRDRLSNATLIAPRKLVIEALEERFAKHPNPIPDKIVGEMGRGMVERNLGITERKSIIVYSKYSVIHFNHESASEKRQRTQRKSYGPMRCYDVPYWHKAKDLVKRFA